MIVKKEVDTFDDSQLIGMNIEEAKDLVKPHLLYIRVNSKDGENYFGIQDFREERINVDLDKSDKIIRINGRG